MFGEEFCGINYIRMGLNVMCLVLVGMCILKLVKDFSR